ncbi:type IV pilus twitching motility protein PilT [Effusibacillus lacus]|uniref:Twitching motility protein PilT n=1 Tax=Effusibacillus lacus TaxID=1348429 RepID=A0A292YI28_9BACL|nr:type IV pilus twitching motility protein PilT [Effusibacillus lacus]TCS74620.1 twitching motility protein PilT [Effusibacillus lacus]GAX88491.1 twitching motility protein PilT [Effusibacillus lacus]
MKKIDSLLRETVERKASDLHVSVGIPPYLRIDGRLVPMGHPALSVEDCASLAKELLGEEAWITFAETGEYDTSYSVPGLARFRVNVFRQRGTVSMALRVIAFGIPTMDTLGLPPVTHEIIKRPYGLILVTGPTGSGKSTTLAAMINEMNRTMERHVITLEDPIEYLHNHNRSIVVQREIGLDTASFSTGLRAALREDPDVIQIGEMRDLETISTAITAAETGHLVLATLHTPDAAQTIDRIIDAFPANQHAQIRLQLSNVLVAIYAQRLLKQRNGNGRVAAIEVLVNIPAVANLIRQEKVHQIKNIIQTGARYGMQTMEQAVDRLIREGKVDPRDCESLMLELRQSNIPF